MLELIKVTGHSEEEQKYIDEVNESIRRSNALRERCNDLNSQAKDCVKRFFTNLLKRDSEGINQELENLNGIINEMKNC